MSQHNSGSGRELRTDGGRPTVLVVDDERDVADAYALKLSGQYDTEVAYGGEDALEKVGPDTDVVLLDRRMPDIHGDDVLDEIRARGLECAVIMVTAVDPDLNILEMDFDDYLCKPVYQDTLTTAIDQQVDTSGEDDRLEEFFGLVSKIEVLESELNPAELSDHDEYNRLKSRAERLGSELGASMDDFDEVVATFKDLNRGAS